MADSDASLLVHLTVLTGVVVLGHVQTLDVVGLSPTYRLLAGVVVLVTAFVCATVLLDGFDATAYRADRGPTGLVRDVAIVLLATAAAGTALTTAALAWSLPGHPLVVGGVGAYLAGIVAFLRRNGRYAVEEGAGGSFVAALQDRPDCSGGDDEPVEDGRA
jgi:hypothetical protein